MNFKNTAGGSFINSVSDSLLTLLYPQACQVCEKSVESKADGFICRECWETARIFTGEEILCRKCSAF